MFFPFLALLMTVTPVVAPLPALDDVAVPTVIITDCLRDPHISWPDDEARIDLPDSVVELACAFGYDEPEQGLRISARRVTLRPSAKVKVAGALQIAASGTVILDATTITASYVSLWADDLVQARAGMVSASYGSIDVGCTENDCAVQLQGTQLFSDNLSVY